LADFSAVTFSISGSNLRSIIIDIDILVPVYLNGYPQKQRNIFKTKALIDTGASRSAVSNTFAETTKLVSYEKCSIRAANGEFISSIYILDILFPRRILINNIKAAEFSGNHNFDFILGLDVLLTTDMALTNAGGNTVLSLRSPPADKHIDFTA
jgi:hypothetical protein